MPQFFKSEDFDLAAALLTAGVPFADDAGQPIEEVYSEERPMRAGIGRRGVQLATSSEDGIETEALRNAYDDAGADKEIDRAIEALPITDAQKAELLHLAQLSAMSYIAHAFRNRKGLEEEAGKNKEPLIEIAKGSRIALVAANGRSDSVNRKLLEKFG
jgi:hypothetical protein